MNIFDTSIIHFINSFSRVSKPFDNFIGNILENNLIKGAVIVSVLWFFWFQKSSHLTFNRGRIIIGIIASIIAIVVSRALTLLLPFRARPFENPDLHFVRPYFMQTEGLETWSSFPSDHAILFFSLSTCIFLISKKVGILSYIYTLLIICFPRVYFGFHYPTDILGGAIIGVAITLILSFNKISTPIIQNIFKFSSKYTGLFYLLFFLLTYQMANLFEQGLGLARYLIYILTEIIKYFI
jgi:undecaprenyl-diphosphatase